MSCTLIVFIFVCVWWSTFIVRPFISLNVCTWLLTTFDLCEKFQLFTARQDSYQILQKDANVSSNVWWADDKKIKIHFVHLKVWSSVSSKYMANRMRKWENEKKNEKHKLRVFSYLLTQREIVFNFTEHISEDSEIFQSWNPRYKNSIF